MDLSWEAGDSWFDRTYTVEHDGQTVATFDSQPSLKKLRDLDRQYREDLETLVACHQAGRWPGYSERIEPMPVPESLAS